MADMKELSILIPTYNDRCTELVRSLQQQAEALGTSYEVIVGDDGSTREDVVCENEAVISALPHCRFIRREQNAGRAAIRNFLAKEARYDYLVFIDADMTVPHPDYLQRYASHPCETVIDGGVIIRGDQTAQQTLRYRYEKHAEQAHLTAERQRHPYQHFHTANFLVARSIMLAHPFDSRFRHYGYEDVFFGKQLKEHQIAIEHIDNPLSFEVFEDDASFISKTEEGLRTLHHFRQELTGYSNMLGIIDRLRPWGILSVIRLWHWLFGSFERQCLTTKKAPLWLFSLYRLGYYLNIKD